MTLPNESRDLHPLHSLSTYLGSFPPKVPRMILADWVPARAVVLDPFCGGGTTLLEAKLAGHPSIGIDLNPLGVAISEAKVQPVDVADVAYRISELARQFPGPRALDDVPDDIRVIFHDRTLAQLCFLRTCLRQDVPEDVFLRGAVLGIMHGKQRRGGGTAYLSIDMPNTFSMSPGYVRRFVSTHKLERPAVDVFSKLRERTRWLLRSGAVPSAAPSTVVQGDATQLPEILRAQGVKTVGAIVTSPPYLGVLRYGAFNWIRLWFLGRSQYDVDRALDSTDSMDVYLSFMVSFFESAAKVTRPGGILALVLGDVSEKGQHVDLAGRIWDELHGLVPFDVVDASDDDYDGSTKTTRIWGEDRKGRATPRDRILILQRVSRRMVSLASA